MMKTVMPSLSSFILAGLGLVILPIAANSEAQESGSQIDEVIVVGQKIERSLQDTKESVVAFGAEDIDERGLIDLKDVLAQAAGVSSATGRSFRIRGIDSGQIGVSRGELASFYVDNVALSGWVKAEGPQQMWDVEQVEIFRGPQSTNFGRNSLAGAISVITADPTYRHEGKFRLGVGNYGTTEFSGMGNLSLADGTSALRLAFDHRETDGSVNNISRGEQDIAYEERQSVRLKWLYEPSEDVRILASLQQVENDYGDNSQAFEASGFDREERIALADVRGEYPIEAILGSLTVDYTINSQWSLKSITAAMDGERSRTDDFDDSAANEGRVMREAEDKNLTQEFRLNFQGESWRGSTGVYFSQLEADNRNNSVVILNLEQLINGLSPGLGTLFVNNGVYPAAYDLMTGGFNNIETTNYAFFSEWEWDMTDHWTLSFGARYDRESQDSEYQNRGSSNVVLPDPAFWGGILGAQAGGAISLINQQLAALSANGPLNVAEGDFDAFLPHLGLTYNFDEGTSLSLFASRGYRTGGTEITGLNTVNDYAPEFLTNVEIALRSLVMGGKGIFNANLYYGDWKDQQVNVPEIPNSTSFFIIENAGKSEIQGLEVIFEYAVSDTLSTYVSAAHSKTEYKNFPSQIQDFSGNEFKLAPETTGTFGGRYASETGFFINANLAYEGHSYADDANTIDIDSHVVANLYVGYEADDWKLEAYSTNLFDEQYPTLIFGSLINGDREWGRMADPREFGLRLHYVF